MMTKTETTLIYEAHRKFKSVFPIGRKPQHDRRSFTRMTGRDGKKYAAFWFDTADNSSHLIKQEVPN